MTTETNERRQLSFDFKGINGPDEYRERVATFTSDANAAKYGHLFESAPELLEACRAAVKMCEAMESHGNMTVVYNAHDMLRRAIARATGAQ